MLMMIITNKRKQIPIMTVREYQQVKSMMMNTNTLATEDRTKLTKVRNPPNQLIHNKVQIHFKTNLI